MSEFSTQYSGEWLQSILMADWLKGRLREKQNTFNREVKITSNKLETLQNFILENFTYLTLVADKEDSGVFLSDTLAIEYTKKSWSIEITIYSNSPSRVNQIADMLSTALHTIQSNIRWVYDTKYFESITVPLNDKNTPVEEMYPFLNGESLSEYYSRFNESQSNILILIGPPGTGKTTFIRGLIKHSNNSATLTYNNKSLTDDSFFVDWLKSDSMYLILEDSDTLLLPRAEGNDLMHRFLNLGDGLMSFDNKKIVFSTNLPHVADIDDALTRPGRCFDILKFDHLNRTEMERLCTRMRMPVPGGNSASLSELFENNKQSQTQKRQSFGFI